MGRSRWEAVIEVADKQKAYDEAKELYQAGSRPALAAPPGARRLRRSSTTRWLLFECHRGRGEGASRRPTPWSLIKRGELPAGVVLPPTEAGDVRRVGCGPVHSPCRQREGVAALSCITSAAPGMPGGTAELESRPTASPRRRQHRLPVAIEARGKAGGIGATITPTATIPMAAIAHQRGGVAQDPQ
jgi:hypothetical protein